MPATLVDLSSQIRRNPAIRSWTAVSCSGVHTELSGAFEVVGCGGMGSGVEFSSTPTVGSSCKALDMCKEVRVGGRVEERGREA